MKLACCGFDEFAEKIKHEGNSIVLFGAGAIGYTIVPALLQSLQVMQAVDCYVDNNRLKWETQIHAIGKNYTIHSAEFLNQCPADTVILLNISRFSDVLLQLEQMECTKNMTCYITPMMLIHNFCKGRSNGKAIRTETPLIPKKLHYMWLGGKPLPDSLQKCKESWMKYCPDYEIIEWNENNYDIAKHPYMKEAYERKAYGFVPDYARLDILYRHGGLYLDTDVELKRNLDELLYQEAFCGVEKWQLLNFGGLSGAVKGHPMIKKYMDARADLVFVDQEGRENRNTCGFYDTPVALREGYIPNGMTQNIGGMNIYASDYFHPYDYMTGELTKTENTFSIHWFNGGWLDEKMKTANEEARRQYAESYQKALQYK